MDKLTDKQLRFIDEYMIDLNASRSAIAAGYSEKTAKEQGSQNLTKLNIQKEISKRQAKLREKTETDQEYIITKLRKIADANIKDFLSYKTVLTKVGVADGKPIFDYAPVIELIDSAEVDGVPIKKVSVSSKGVFTFELEAKQPAIDSLAKHLGFYEHDNLQKKTDIEAIMETLSEKAIALLEKL